MNLSNDLISQFVKVTRDTTETKKDTQTYGRVVVDPGNSIWEGQKVYVVLDGSTTKIPVEPRELAVAVDDGDRVAVTIRNHIVTVTSNLSDPAAKSNKVNQQITEVEHLIGDFVTAEELEAELASFDTLIADYATIKDTLYAENGVIDDLYAEGGVIDILESNSADIEELKTDMLTAEVADIRYVTADSIKATDAYINNLVGTYAEFVDLTVDRLDAIDGKFDNLYSEYANIDFSNIGKASIENLMAKSGLIENVVVGDGTITGVLVGVTIRGDSIEGNTIVADKLVIRGEDGLYYKLNTDGVTTEAEQTEYNSLNGSIITARSITATQISVDDLVAFDATIGGFTITDDSIYSDVKDSEGNTTRGIYMDTDGQINFGDESNYIKYYKDEDGTYKLVVSAASILYALDGKQHSISDLGLIGEYVHVSTYEGEPCIELGESDSDFKLIITNTRIMFMEGSTVPAYINNQSLHITKAVIEEEIQQGEFVWKVRDNGNMGLMWKGEV